MPVAQVEHDHSPCAACEVEPLPRSIDDRRIDAKARLGVGGEGQGGGGDQPPAPVVDRAERVVVLIGYHEPSGATIEDEGGGSLAGMVAAEQPPSFPIEHQHPSLLAIGDE